MTPEQIEQLRNKHLAPAQDAIANEMLNHEPGNNPYEEVLLHLFTADRLLAELQYADEGYVQREWRKEDHSAN